MACTRCGSALLGQSGQCAVCGQPVAQAYAYAPQQVWAGQSADAPAYGPPPQVYGPPAPAFAPPPAPAWQPAGVAQAYMMVPQPGYGATVGSGRTLSIAAFVFAAVALAFIPILFGAIAAVLASMAKKRGERWAPVALKVAVASTAFGMVIGVIVRMAGA